MTIVKKPKKEKLVLVNFKASKEDVAILSARAKKYAEGNLSLWLRYSGMNHVPKKKA